MGVSGGQPNFLTTLPWGNDPGTHWVGGQVGPTVGMNAVEKRYIICFAMKWPTEMSNPLLSYIHTCNFKLNARIVIKTLQYINLNKDNHI